MKKIFSLFMFSLLIFPCFLFTGCGDSFSDLTITNFSEYESIAVGVGNTSAYAKSTDNIASAESVVYAENFTKHPRLMGKRRDGSFEEVKFQEKTNINSKYNVCGFQPMGRFTRIAFRPEPVDYVVPHAEFYGRPDFRNFLLDNKSGKMYNISDYNFSTDGHSYKSWGYTEDAVIGEISQRKDGKATGIFKFSVENGNLKIEELLNSSDYAYGNFEVDRYGNLYASKNIGGRYVQCIMVTNTGKIKELPYEFNVYYNRIAYSATKCINEKGEIVDADYHPTYVAPRYLLSSNIFYKENNIYYFRDSNQITKLEIIDDIHYNVERYSMKKIPDSREIEIDNRIYFLENNKIYYIDIKNGEYTAITTNYFISTINKNEQGVLIFNAVDENLNKVIGTLNENDEFTTEIKPRDIVIYYVTPVN